MITFYVCEQSDLQSIQLINNVAALKPWIRIYKYPAIDHNVVFDGTLELKIVGIHVFRLKGISISNVTQTFRLQIVNVSYATFEQSDIRQINTKHASFQVIQSQLEIKTCNISDNTLPYDFIQLNSSNVSISMTNINQNSQLNIKLSQSFFVVLYSNITKNSIQIQQNGLLDHQSSLIFAANNMISNIDFNILLLKSDQVVFRDNHIYDNGYMVVTINNSTITMINNRYLNNAFIIFTFKYSQASVSRETVRKNKGYHMDCHHGVRLEINMNTRFIGNMNLNIGVYDTNQASIRQCLFQENVSRSAKIIDVQTSNLIIETCNFNNNKQIIGIVNTLHSVLKVKNTVFWRNVAETHDKDDNNRTMITSDESTLEIQDSEFKWNINYGYGGCIYKRKGSMMVSNTKFYSNKGFRGGALFAFDVVDLQVQDSEFEQNDANMTGSCIFIKNDDTGTIRIRNSSFNHNTNQCIKLYKSPNTSISISDSTFKNNSIYCVNATEGAALNLHEYLNISIRNNRFEGNNALQAGSIYIRLISFSHKDTIVIENNHFQNNYAYQIASCIYMDLAQAYYNPDFWIDQEYKYNDYLQKGYLRINGNVFIGNIAEFAGSVMRLNGNHKKYFNTKDFIQHVKSKERNNRFIMNKVNKWEYYQHDVANEDQDILTDCIYGEYNQVDRMNTSYCQSVKNMTYSNIQGRFNYYSQCPTGLICPGGYKQLIIEENYYRNSHDDLGIKQSLITYKCDRNGTCLSQKLCSYSEECQKKTDGSLNSSDGKRCCTVGTYCLKGYAGPKCMTCDLNPDQQGGLYYMYLECTQCSSFYSVFLLYLFHSFLELLQILFLIYCIKRKIKKDIQKKVMKQIFGKVFRSDFGDVVAFLKMYFIQMQTIMFFFLFKFAHQEHQSVEQYMYYVIFEIITVFKPSYKQIGACVASWFTHDTKLSVLKLRLVYYLLLPFVITFVYYLKLQFQLYWVQRNLLNQYQSQNKDISQINDSFLKGKLVENTQTIRNQINECKRRQQQFRSKFMSMFVLSFSTTFFYSLPQLFDISLNQVICYQVAQKDYLLADSYYSCETGQQNIVFVIVLILLMSLIFVYYVYVITQKDKRSIMATNIYAFLCQEYRPEVYYFEIIKFLQMVFIILFMKLFYNNEGIKFQFFACLVLILINLQWRLKPYRNKFIQKINNYYNYSIFINLVLIIPNLNIQDDHRTTYHQNEQTTVFLIICKILLLVVNLVTNIYINYQVFRLFCYQNRQQHYISKYYKNQNEQSEKARKHWKILSQYVVDHYIHQQINRSRLSQIHQSIEI